MQSYHLYIGQLESHSLSLSLLLLLLLLLLLFEKTCVCTGSYDCGSYLPLVLRLKTA
jgi:hypothetical protein